jgi:hypothetical protein
MSRGAMSGGAERGEVVRAPGLGASEAGSRAIPFASAAFAATPTPQPLPRSGSCPSGYSSSDGYCTPGPSARFAVPRNAGPCPRGYSSSGDYCLASSNSSKLAVPKTGSCPSGFSSSGAHCLSSR